MKRYLLLVIPFLASISPLYAADGNTPIPLTEVLTTYYTTIGANVPTSYQYIEVRFTNVTKGTPLYEAIQRGIYLNVITNKSAPLPLDRTITEGDFADMIKRQLGVFIPHLDKKVLTRQRFATMLARAIDRLKSSVVPRIATGSIIYHPDFSILDDVYLRLRFGYYDGASLSTDTMLSDTIKGMTRATKDPHTVYFTPDESKHFLERLTGEFGGIGAYMVMTASGNIVIAGLTPGGPAATAGMMTGDVLRYVGSLAISSETDIDIIIATARGNVGTSVTIGISRGDQNYDLTIVRAIVRIDYVSYARLAPTNANYIRIDTFGRGTAEDFSGALMKVLDNTDNNTIILDLRDDPGGDLSEVEDMLSMLVPRGEPVIRVKYRGYETSTVSTGDTYATFQDKNFIILIDARTASAAEVMTATMRDYLPHVRIIGKQSFGKGSVQDLHQYANGSTLKYTVAKWFSGKTRTAIDGVGITPDIDVELDIEKAKRGIDSQLEFAKNYRFSDTP